MIVRRSLVVAVVLAVLTAAACGSDGPTGIAESGVGDTVAGSSDTTAAVAQPDDEPDADAPDPDDAGTDDGSDDTGSGGGSGGSTSGGSLDPPVPGQFAGAELVSVELLRQSDTLRIDFAIANNGTEAISWGTDLAASATQFNLPTGINLFDTEQQVRITPLALGDDGRCVCSELERLQPGVIGRYHITFSDVPQTDLELYIPTFPLLPVRGDVVGQPTDPATIGLAPNSTSPDGVELTWVAAQRRGQQTLVEFRIVNGTEDSYSFGTNLSASPTQFERPTGLTIFDPSVPEQWSPPEPDDVACLCSRLIRLQPGQSATHFVLFDGLDSTTVNLTVPTFQPVTDLPIAG